MQVLSFSEVFIGGRLLSCEGRDGTGSGFTIAFKWKIFYKKQKLTKNNIFVDKSQLWGRTGDSVVEARRPDKIWTEYLAEFHYGARSVIYYDKRGCEMGNSVIHFVRAQSKQRFNTPPLGAVRASKASSPQYRLARPCGTFIDVWPCWYDSDCEKHWCDLSV